MVSEHRPPRLLAHTLKLFQNTVIYNANCDSKKHQWDYQGLWDAWEHQLQHQEQIFSRTKLWRTQATEANRRRSLWGACVLFLPGLDLHSLTGATRTLHCSPGELQGFVAATHHLGQDSAAQLHTRTAAQAAAQRGNQEQAHTRNHSKNEKVPSFFVRQSQSHLASPFSHVCLYFSAQPFHSSLPTPPEPSCLNFSFRSQQILSLSQQLSKLSLTRKLKHFPSSSYQETMRQTR